MTIKVGDSLPDAVFTVNTADGPQPRTTAEIFKGRKVILFGVPGAFTPTCHRNHLPGFLAHSMDFKNKGVDEICVTSVNDIFVMNAWEKDTAADGRIKFLSDGSGKFAKAIGLSADMSERNFGLRSQRYSMLVDDGVVQKLNIEETPGKAELSGAEALLGQM
jgi:peroxiredoxin